VEIFDVVSLRAALGPINQRTFMDLDLDKNGFPLKAQPTTYANVKLALAGLGVEPRLNLMNGKASYILPERIDMARFGAMTGREVDALVEDALMDQMNRAGLKNKREVRDCIARLANANYWHPAKDWIESVPWDGVDRFEALCGSVTTDTPDLLRIYFRRWCLQGIEAACGWTVRRDTQKALCLVLAGRQGVGKTRWLMSLAPGFCCEGKHLSLDAQSARDSKHEALQGMIVELGELDTTFRKTAVGSMKAFMSATTDEYRLPYADMWLVRPRCTSFCGSVNDKQFLQDVSGNRRFAALWVDRCDPEHGIDMQQFWAQVHAWWTAGEQWWLTPEEEKLQAGNNAQFQTTDGIAEQIEDEIVKRQDRERFTVECGLSQTQVCQLLGIRHDQNGLMARVGVTLREHLGEHKDLRKRGGAPRGWRWWLTRTEVESLGVTPLLPVKS
jgi:putative DNA primase/helicase